MSNTANPKSILDWALFYKSLGYSVIPIKHGTKKPCIPWKEYQTKIATEDEIRLWYQQFPDAQVGIVTGEISNLYVVDVDAKNGGMDSLDSINYPVTATVETGGGGIHLLFSTPKNGTPRNSVGNIAPGIDLRAGGGYIVASPSLHPSGTQYKWLLPLDKAPSPLPELPEWAYKKRTESKDSPSGWNKIVNEEILEGSRNDSAAQLAGKLLSVLPKDLWELAGWSAMLTWNQKINQPPLEESELRKVFESIVGLEETQDIDLLITPCTELLHRTPEAQPYIIDKMIPANSITSITAESGDGKSMLALIMAQHIASGEKFLHRFDVKQGRVLIIDQEMNENTIIERVQSVFDDEAIAGNVDIIYDQPFKIDNQAQRDRLINLIVENKYLVLILDTFSTIHSKDDNSSKDMAEINQHLLEVIRNTGATILYLHHHRKTGKGERRGQNTSRGSTEIIAKVSSHIMLTKTRVYLDEKTNQEVTCLAIEQLKSRLPGSFPEFTIDVSHNRETNKTKWAYGERVDKDKKAVDKAREVILALLEQNEEISFAYIAEKTNIKKGSARSALTDLVKEGIASFREGEKNAKYYSLTKESLPD